MQELDRYLIVSHVPILICFFDICNVVTFYLVYNGKQKKPVGSTLDKIVSCYQVVQKAQREEEVIVSKCRGTVGLLEKMEKDAVQNNLGEGTSLIFFVTDIYLLSLMLFS